MSLLQECIRELLVEKQRRGQKDKRTLYHINMRPARPQPKVKMMQQWDAQAKDRFGEEGDFVDVPETDNWQRYWLDSPVKSGVFLTPNPLDVAMNHGRSGNVYAYKVPEWVIDKSGGMHRYDTGSEVLIPEDVWNEAGDEIEFLGKTMEQKQLWDKMDSSMFGRGHHRKAKKPSWLTGEELKQWESDVASRFNLSGLRSTKHPEAAIKMMKPDEVKRALAALEKKYPQEGPSELERGPRDKKGIVVPFFGRQPDKKDEELIAMLKKRQNESVVRDLVREILTEKIKSIEDVKTVGDLKKLIKHASGKNKGKAGGKGLADTAIDIVVDEIQALIPGFATVKNLAMAAKGAYKLDDEAKSGSALDVMNVDDDISKIVDDPVENAFMKDFAKKLEKIHDDTPISSLDVTKALTKWISDKFNNTQVAKPKSEAVVRDLVRELLSEQNIQAAGMCFPFAYQKAEEWFESHYTKGRPGRSAKKHPDLNNKDKFKVVHGTVTDKWKSPPKPIVHGWVEMGDLVFDSQTSPTKPNGINKEIYYDMYQPEVYKEFTAEEAILNCAMMGGEGPWDDELYDQMRARDAWLET